MIASMRIMVRENLGEPFPPGTLRWTCESAFDGLRDRTIVVPGVRTDWIVAVHGHGSHDDQLFTRADIRRYRLPRMLKSGMGILSPNLRDNAWMSPAAVSDLHGRLGLMRAEFGARRFFFFSGSMGGASNLYYALQHPDDVAALVALGAAPDAAPYAQWCRAFAPGSIQRQIGEAIEKAYGGSPETNPEPYRARSAAALAGRLVMPIYYAHGEKDALMPIEAARKFASAMGGNPLFHFLEIPGGNHDSPLLLQEPMDWMEKAAG